MGYAHKRISYKFTFAYDAFIIPSLSYFQNPVLSPSLLRPPTPPPQSHANTTQTHNHTHTRTHAHTQIHTLTQLQHCQHSQQTGQIESWRVRAVRSGAGKEDWVSLQLTKRRLQRVQITRGVLVVLVRQD